MVRNGNGGWRRLGSGGSSSGYEDRTAEAFERARNDLAAHQVVVNGGVAVLRASNRVLPWTGRWVRTATVLVGGGIAQLVVGGRRLPVRYHGHLVVVWGSCRPPSATARDAAGRTVVTVTLPDDR